MIDNKSYAHLGFHSHYSMSEGLGDLNAVMKTAKKSGIWAMALTDVNMFGYVKFFQAAIKHGIKPICGVELPMEYVASDRSKVFGSIVLLVKNDDGYKNICRIVSLFNLSGEQAFRDLHSLLEQGCDGLMGVIPGVGGIIEAMLDKNDKEAEGLATKLNNLFAGDCYFGIYHDSDSTGMQTLYNQQALALAKKLKISCIASHPSFFQHAADSEAHGARVDIVQINKSTDSRYRPDMYIKSAHHMHEAYAQHSVLLQNTDALAAQCNYQLKQGVDFMPKIKSKDDQSPKQILEHEVYKGLMSNLGVGTREQIPEAYALRAETELGVINSLNYPDYFLVMQEMIQFAKDSDIPVGPGRGSAAGSLIAWALGITSVQLDPLKYGLLFERFLNKDRVSLPDIDIDICSARRDELIEHVSLTFGRDRVAQIAAIGTMAAKMSIKDAARHLGKPNIVGKRIADAIPVEADITIAKALLNSKIFAEFNNIKEDREVIELAMQLEGTARNLSKHAAGIVIAPESLNDLVPLVLDEETNTEVTQYDNRDLETLGFVKFDLLGLSTLTLLDKTLKLINQRNIDEKPVELGVIPLNDTNAFKLIATTTNIGIFQLENPRMQDIIHRFAPVDIEELAALLALIRPGPLTQGMVDMAIDRKHNLATSKNKSDSHPVLDENFPQTWGMLIYQEQVMELARIVAKYSYGEADLLRRAMGKKDVDFMAKQKQGFLERAVKNNFESEQATKLFDLIEKFAGYGFNKSHSMGYALLSYWSAWLKYYYPNEFFTVGLQLNTGKDDRLRDFTYEARKLGCVVRAPCINRSAVHFELIDNEIYYGYGAIKGMSNTAADLIVKERKAGGHYKDLFDLCKRVDPSKIGNASFEAQIRSGGLESFGTSQSVLHDVLPKAIAFGNLYIESQNQIGLFGSQADSSTDQEQVYAEIDELANWSASARSRNEKKSCGFNLLHHPSKFWKTVLQKQLTYDSKLQEKVLVWQLDEFYYVENNDEGRYRLQLSNEEKVIYITRKKSAIDELLGDELSLTKNTLFVTFARKSVDLQLLSKYLEMNFRRLIIKPSNSIDSQVRSIRAISSNLPASKGRSSIEVVFSHAGVRGSFQMKNHLSSKNWVEYIDIASQYFQMNELSLLKAKY